MFLDAPVPLPLKRRRLASVDPMEVEAAKAKFAAIKEKFGREIRVFETSAASPSSHEVSNSAEETDDFYEFTAEDYYRISASKKEDKFLKTRKIREAEEAARKPKITKAVIRVRFPDHHTLEVTFHASETIQSLVDLLKKVVTRPELPFYIYTAPPKKQITDMPQDFYNAGFVPGAIVYFSYDLREGDDSTDANSAPFLQEEIMSLKDLDFSTEQSQQAEAVQSAPEPVPVTPATVVQEQKAAGKKPVKPKWLRM